MTDATYPNAAGWKGASETGREAAMAMEPESARLRRVVLGLAGQRRSNGLTPEEASDLSGLARVSLQPRFSELRAAGKLIDSGRRRRNPSSGRRAIVWVLPEYAPAKTEVAE